MVKNRAFFIGVNVKLAVYEKPLNNRRNYFLRADIWTNNKWENVVITEIVDRLEYPLNRELNVDLFDMLALKIKYSFFNT